ncbi:MAG: carboxypeptidase regulatory-like domain-containing protein [Gemmatimonadetes bacterium]|nr:carboxypeptidase regulatory-like domain-containing protein [Gemmatimonadota bacterium]
MRILKLIALILLALGATQAARAQDTTAKARDTTTRVAADTARKAASGALVGKITDQGGKPLGGADIVVQGTAMRVKSRNDGSFTLAGIPVGDWDILFRKLGYDPAEFTLNVVPGQQISVAIKLGQLSQKLDTVTITAEVFNEFAGLVTDSLDRPLEGVEITIEGSEHRYTTRADGRFLFLDIPPGKYILRFRKMGYRARQQALQMVKRIDRNLTVRMGQLAQSLSAVEITAESGFSGRDSVAQRDFAVRRKMSGTQADFISREDLADAGKSPLNLAIRQVARGIPAKELWNAACVLVDGQRPLIDPSTPIQLANGGSGGAFGGSASNPSGERNIPGGAGFTTLQTIFADQVELVEVYPAGSENSLTACARFPITIPQCDCNAARSRPIVVVWLRK